MKTECVDNQHRFQLPLLFHISVFQPTSVSTHNQHGLQLPPIQRFQCDFGDIFDFRNNLAQFESIFVGHILPVLLFSKCSCCYLIDFSFRFSRSGHGSVMTGRTRPQISLCSGQCSFWHPRQQYHTGRRRFFQQHWQR